MNKDLCVLCKSDYKLKEFHGGYICEDCRMQLSALYKSSR